MNEALWRDVETALDARIDPFDDPDLAAALAADPAAERAARRLTGRLALLVDTPLAERRPTRAPRVAAAAAAILMFAAAALYSGHSGASPEPVREPIRTMSLVVEHTLPPPARGARVVLEPRLVTQWSLEGEAP